MKKFNVIWWDFNNKEPTSYDIIPHLIDCYKTVKKKPKTFEEFKEFIIKRSMGQWWSRCEYEIIISDWPSMNKSKKIDIHNQVMMNIDIITELLIKSIKDG